MGLETKAFGRAILTVEYLDENDQPTKVYFQEGNAVLYTETTFYRLEKGKTVKDYTEYVIRCQVPANDQD